MLIESPHLHSPVTAGGKRVLVTGMTSITRRSCPDFFPSFGFDPLGALPGGNFYTPPSQKEEWERFSARTTSLMVPRVLTDLVREKFPTCRWDLAGTWLYAVLDQRVVAIIGDGALEGW